MTVHELLSRVSARELAQWKIFLKQEPIGYEMQNWRSAMIAYTIESNNPYRSKSAKKPKMKDFMPQFKPEIDPYDDSGIYGDPL